MAERFENTQEGPRSTESRKNFIRRERGLVTRMLEALPRTLNALPGPRGFALATAIALSSMIAERVSANTDHASQEQGVLTDVSERGGVQEGGLENLTHTLPESERTAGYQYFCSSMNGSRYCYTKTPQGWLLPDASEGTTETEPKEEQEDQDQKLPPLPPMS